MGKVGKLHRRLVKKRGEIKMHRKTVAGLLQVLAMYADMQNWQATDNTRDVVEGSIVVGVEQVWGWQGPGQGPELAQGVFKK